MADTQRQHHESTPIAKEIAPSGYSCPTKRLPVTSTVIENEDNHQVTSSGSEGLGEKHTILEEMDVEQDKQFSFSKVPRRKKYILILCSMANLISACAYSLLRPFFPAEAAKKGMDLTMIGFVIGVFHLVVFVTSPVVGYVIPRVGVKFTQISGIFIGGSCVILFGLLGESPGGTIFLVMCILVRSVEASGFAAFKTANMTIVSCEFEGFVGSVVALLRCATAMGNVVGPLIGGVLYDIGGFSLPFYCLAVPTLLNVVFMFKVSPSLESEKADPVKSKSMLELSRSPFIIVLLITLFLAAGGLYGFMAMFSMYVEPLNISPSLSAALYTIAPGVYTLLAPLWGYITDVKKKSQTLIVTGLSMYAIGCLLLSGPKSVFSFINYSLPYICIGAVAQGVGFGCALIPIMRGLIDGALELGFERGPETFGKVSGLHNSVFALAGFLGPFCGGIFVEQYGFSAVFLAMALVNIIWCGVTLVFFAFRHYVHRKGK